MKLFGLTLLAAMVLTGCQTTGPERSASAAGDTCISVPMPNFKIQTMPKALGCGDNLTISAILR